MLAEIALVVFGIILGSLSLTKDAKSWLRWVKVSKNLWHWKLSELKENLAYSIIASFVFVLGSILFFVCWWERYGNAIENLWLPFRAFFAIAIAVSPWPFYLLTQYLTSRLSKSLERKKGKKAKKKLRREYLGFFIIYSLLIYIVPEILMRI